MQSREIVVSISCITYNHAPYIRQCLDGFMMQKTDFAFEVLIHDDASTDGTAEIIKEYEARYPDVIKPIYEDENQWVKGRRGSPVFNFPRATGKYIAMCEGDDYWTDPYKLQKQVDILNSNPHYVMCSHAYDVILQEQKQIERNEKTENFEYSIDDLTSGAWPAQTVTVMFRSSSVKDIPVNNVGDVVLFYLLLMQGRGIFLKDIMAGYRIHENGIWGGVNKSDRIKASFDSRLYVYEIDSSVNAAQYILSMFKMPIPKEWYKSEFKQLLRIIRILLRHISPVVVIKCVIANIRSSFKN